MPIEKFFELFKKPKKEKEPEPKPELSQEKIKEIVEKQRKFLENGGVVYDPKFIELEEQDIRKYKVAFDFHGVICSARDSNIIRPGAQELLNNLNKRKIKIAIWSTSTTEDIENIARLDIPFDIIISGKNYFTEEELSKQLIPVKNIKKINYDLLVEDTPAEITRTEEKGGKGIVVSSYHANPKIYKGNEPLPEDLEQQILEALNYEESKE